MAVLSWGDNTFGQLGVEQALPCISTLSLKPCREPDGEREKEREPKLFESKQVLELVPRPLKALQGNRVLMVAAGESHSLVLDHFGKLWAMGRNKEGQLGVGNRQCSARAAAGEGMQPRRVCNLDHEMVIQVSCGALHSLAVTRAGRAYAWGLLHTVAAAGPATAVGAPAPARESEAQQMVGLTGGNAAVDRAEVLRIVNRSESMYKHGAAVGATASAATSVRRIQTVPWRICGLEGRKVKAAAGGYSYTMLLAEGGALWGFGYNDQGQLGLGHRANQALPAPTRGLEGVEICHVACGQQHTLAVATNGDLYSFGSNIFEQLGPRTAPLRSDDGGTDVCGAGANLLPAKVALPEHCVHADCGNFHSVAVSAQGTVYVWGHSEYAQLGQRVEGLREDADLAAPGGGAGGDAPPLVVVRALASEHVVTVSCGSLFTSALTKSGKLFSWGWGAGGALGHGTDRYRLRALQVTSLGAANEIQAMAAGGKHMLVVTTTPAAAGLGRMLSDVDTCDLAFLVGPSSQLMLAHLFVIAARCPWLAAQVAMERRFTNKRTVAEMALPEKVVHTLHLPKVTPQVFEPVLEYLYTDTVSRLLPHVAHKVAVVAKRYHLPRLQAMSRIAALGGEVPHQEPVPHSRFVTDMRKGALYNGLKHDIMFTAKTGGPLVSADGTDCAEGAAPPLPHQQTLTVHKAVLTHSTEYFRTLLLSEFWHNGRRSAEGVLQMDDDISYEVLSSIVDYFYTGDVEFCYEDPELAINVLAAANRLMADSLKQELEVALIEVIDDTNASFLAEFAELHSATALQQACLDHLSAASVGEADGSAAVADAPSTGGQVETRAADALEACSNSGAMGLATERVVITAVTAAAAGEGDPTRSASGAAGAYEESIRRVRVTAQSVRAGRGRLRRRHSDD